MTDLNLFHTPYSLLATSPMTSVQRPTLQTVRIRSVRDALQVFYGVATERIPLITRRLDAEERRAIISGNVYVWEERGANTEPTGLGMERWTDGMGWGPSRVRDEFLFYHQKESNFSDDLLNPVTPWAQMMRLVPFDFIDYVRLTTDIEFRYIRKRESAVPQMPGYTPKHADRLVKQTYSVHVTLPNDSPRGAVRKWHLTAYFSQQHLDQLATVDEIKGVGDIAVPDGLFKSARTGKTRRDHRSPSKKGQTQREITTYGEGPSNISRDSSPSSDSPGPQSLSPINTDPQLVPLKWLKNASGTRRDPVDEQLLKLFPSQMIGTTRTSSWPHTRPL